MKFKNKVAIVTGSSRGIGKATALELAKNGASVVISSTKLENCTKIVKEIEDFGGKAIAVKCDVSNSKDVKNLVDTTIKNFGKIDILVNNAGIGPTKAFEELTEEERDFVININLKGVFLCTNNVIKYMLKQKSGKIISISSILGKRGFAHASSYCTTKAAVINLTRSLAIEYASRNININAVAPGFIRTDMTKESLENDEVSKMLLNHTPAGRFGEAEEIAKAVAFLASDDASYIHGETL
ncbi:MAG TPA: 3-oxoacyl-ACP reductase family protein, partial [Candidatus Absconditabacterales bacterium]|nr:3-oxoacyl-ACP reductase family protein [Candidatus Absconditabacterales bacterium]